MVEIKTDLAKVVDAYDITFKEEADRMGGGLTDDVAISKNDLKI
jgi:hypothetical protein